MCEGTHFLCRNKDSKEILVPIRDESIRGGGGVTMRTITLQVDRHIKCSGICQPITDEIIHRGHSTTR